MTASNTPPVRQKANTSSMGCTAARIMMLDRAAGYLGQAVLASALGIGVRALQHKLATARGVSDTDLRLAAAALDSRAETLASQAATMRSAAR